MNCPSVEECNGTGKSGFSADVGITEDRITAIGDLPTSADENARIIEADGVSDIRDMRIRIF